MLSAPFRHVNGKQSTNQRVAPLPFAPAARAPAASDFGPENEPFAARLGRRTGGWRKGWVVEYRFAAAIDNHTPQQVPPACESQLQDVGRGAASTTATRDRTTKGGIDGTAAAPREHALPGGLCSSA